MIHRQPCLLSALGSLVVACGAIWSYADEPRGEPQSQKAAADEEGWGEAVNGMRLRLRARNPTVAHDGVLHLMAEFRNVSREDMMLP